MEVLYSRSLLIRNVSESWILYFPSVQMLPRKASCTRFRSRMIGSQRKDHCVRESLKFCSRRRKNSVPLHHLDKRAGILLILPPLVEPIAGDFTTGEEYPVGMPLSKSGDRFAQRRPDISHMPARPFLPASGQFLGVGLILADDCSSLVCFWWWVLVLLLLAVVAVMIRTAVGIVAGVVVGRTV
ncbi:uncharacterized protein H6S33_009524 [Morchella sextelata]|uniref:uncharacterized protein n=1 Tax=Morchella sextelata TaxID=1174677 RepID=UPI001D0419BB|nr:uncharacterized protein H6S33_009524 [Morchella sextelata]KAH0613144.1 hypothetical protein H6S33_009524 [Morchella sextelata]